MDEASRAGDTGVKQLPWFPSLPSPVDLLQAEIILFLD